jgi:CTP:molybdopterin cytidylyltransferase MocA
LLELRGDKGARALLKDPSCPLVTIDFAGGEVDVDVPADLEQLQ